MEISLDRVEGGMLIIVILDIFGADRVLCTTATFLLSYIKTEMTVKIIISIFTLRKCLFLNLNLFYFHTNGLVSL